MRGPAVNGIILNVQRACTRDGPGIRTTVFFKGCPLRCAWCHNPETISMKPVLMHYQNKCIGCGMCAKGCPTDCIKRTDYIPEGHKLASFEIDTSKCVKCGYCMSQCRLSAISKR